MRISEDRYLRDLRPLLLAERMLRLEARTRTICTWTGLSRDRVRKLAGSTLPPRDGRSSVRHRGRSPRQTSYFFRSPHIYAHANVLASYFAMADVLPDPPDTIPARDFPSILRGERLCETYECYSIACSRVAIDFERGMLLAIALAERDEVDLARCTDCGGLILVDLLARDDRGVHLCQACKMPDASAPASPAIGKSGVLVPEQMQLFAGTDGTEPHRLNGSIADSFAAIVQGENTGSAVAATASSDDKDSISIRDISEPDENSR